MLRLIIYTLSICLLAGVSAEAAGFTDPNWPCIQRKVENISVGQMWPHPIEQMSLSDGAAAAVEELALRLSLRRNSLEEAEEHVATFANTAGRTPNPALMGRVFVAVFQRLNQRRTRLIQGIERYAGKQAALSEKIDRVRTKIKHIEQQDAPDFDKIDALEEKLDWDQRIYEERAKSLTYVCETPVRLEKRAYAVGQMLLRHILH